MKQNTLDPQKEMTRLFSLIALASTGLFLILLITLHFIEPEFEPSKHLISEYELGRFGFLMSLAFFSLGAGLLSTIISTWADVKTIGGLVGRLWFLVLFTALIGAGIFYPYAEPNTASKLHTLCGMLVIFTLPIAATVYGSGLSKSSRWSDSKRLLLIAALIAWLGFTAFIGSLLIFRPVRTPGHVELVVGWQNRFMMLCYSAWIILLNAKIVFNKSKAV